MRIDSPIDFSVIPTEFGIRPHNHKIWLRVTNGKNSFGRACGTYRYLSLDDYPTEFIDKIRDFIALNKQKSQKTKRYNDFIRNQSYILNNWLNKQPLYTHYLYGRRKVIAKQIAKAIKDDSDKQTYNATN